tara:strand:- start:133 stop:1389 length:1257 start_codon:yes stop_codon:yes gene_type:complete
MQNKTHNPPNNISINEKRLWNSLMQMAEIGKTELGGVNRQALTDLDKKGRKLFETWAKEAKLQITIDNMGNIFARRDGKNNNLPPIMTGSHLDSQPTGGKFDGPLGVLSGLEVVRSLNDANYTTDAPIEIVVWTNEEGCRFAPSMTGSGVFSGAHDIKDIHQIQDTKGISLIDELKRIEYFGNISCKPRPIGAFIETHIEQGPILEEQECVIGIVTGAQGQKWYEVNIKGQESHAGTTPMQKRKDALLAGAKIVTSVNEITKSCAPDGRGTCGVLDVFPASRNVIPGKVFLTIDIRHPEASELNKMESLLKKSIQEITINYGVEISVNRILDFNPVPFNQKIFSTIKKNADQLGLQNLDIVSGAGHDAVNIQKIAPSGMIFIPCKDGISHNEAEHAESKHVAAGANVLLQTIIELANT